MEWPYYVLADLTKTEPIPMDQVLSYPVRVYDPLPINELTTPVWKRQSLDMGMAHLADDSHEPEGVISTLELAKANAAFQAAQKKKQQLKEKGALPYDVRSDLNAIQDQQQKILKNKKDDLIEEQKPKPPAAVVAENLRKEEKTPDEDSIKKADKAATNAEQAAAVTKTFDAYLEELRSENLFEITEKQLNQLKQLAGDDENNLKQLHAFVVKYLQEIILQTVAEQGAEASVVDSLNRLIESYATQKLITPTQSAELSADVNQYYDAYHGTSGHNATADQVDTNVANLGKKTEEDMIQEGEETKEEETKEDNILNQPSGNTTVPLNPPARKDANGDDVELDNFGKQELTSDTKELDPDLISVDKLVESQTIPDATNVSDETSATNVPNKTDEEVSPTPADSGTGNQNAVATFIERVGDFMPPKVREAFESVKTTGDFTRQFGNTRYKVICELVKNPSLKGEKLAVEYKDKISKTKTGKIRTLKPAKVGETEGWGYEEFKKLVNKYKRRRIN